MSLLPPVGCGRNCRGKIRNGGWKFLEDVRFSHPYGSPSGAHNVAGECWVHSVYRVQWGHLTGLPCAPWELDLSPRTVFFNLFRATVNRLGTYH